MALTPAQKTTLKTHAAANTNTIQAFVAGQVGLRTVAIKDVTELGDNFQFVADWYNGLALAGDNQPIASPLLVWRPSVSIQQLNSAVDWTAQPAGATAADVSNGWLKWQTMIWNNAIDLTDQQVRQGIDTVWGAASASATAIKGAGIGRQAGTRLEVLLAGNAVGGARVSQVFGYKLTGPEVSDALLNG